MVFKASLIVLSATAFGHFFNYLYHLITARFLSPAQFGLLESFVALNYLLAVLISTFSLSVINQLNQTKSRQLSTTIAALQRLAIKLTLGSWFVFLLAYPWLKHLLHLTQPYLFLIFSFQLLLAFIPSLYTSSLRAKLKFVPFSLVNLTTPIIRTLAVFILLLLGWQVLGAITSMVIAGLSAACLSLYLASRLLSLKLKAKPIKLSSGFWHFSLITLITTLSLTSIYSADILLARYLLSPNQAGLYSAVSILGRIIFFASAAVYAVAFPIFSQSKALPQLKTHFIQAFILTSLISFAGLFSYYSFPQLVIKLIGNPSYLPASPYLPNFALFMALFSLFHLIILFLLSRQHQTAAWLASLTALAQICLIILRHPNIQLIIQNSIIAVSFGLLFSLIFAIKVLNVKTN